MRSKKNIFQESIELDEKQTPSDKVFHLVGLWCGSIACGLQFLCLIFFYAWPEGCGNVWMYAFYPIVAFLLAGLFCSGAQILRNRYFSSVVALILNILAGVALITVTVVQAIVYREIFIIPFIWM